MWITSLNLRNKGEAPHLALVNIPVPAQRRTFDITLYCKQASKLPKYVLKESKTLFCTKFLRPHGPVCVLAKWSRYAPANKAPKCNDSGQ